MAPGSGGPGAAPAPAVATSRFYRLSHAQWENSVRDLLGLAASPRLAAGFSKDAVDSFSNDGEALSVSDQLRLDYQQAAEDLAQRVVADPALLGKLIPAGAPADPAGRGRAFIRELGRRAHRRPLADGEVEEYFALFGKASGEADPFAAGSTLVLQAMLQSPYFLYRTELGTGPGRTRLDGYEIAAKLSYALTASMPDQPLSSAAAAGALATNEGVGREATRLLAGPGPARAFHAELLALDDYAQIDKDISVVPEFSPTLTASMRQEADAFLGDVYASGGGLEALLTAPFTYVDAALAALYGVAAPPRDAMVRTPLDPGQRAGFLTRVGFLANFASSVDPDPIHRGAFINERILCVQLPPPATTVFPDPPMGAKTNRERIEAVTGKGTCGEACHGRWMNPAGFAFEHYDVLGRYRTTDNGEPVNSADTYPFSDGPRSYADAVEFSKALAGSQDAHRCYARNWLAYLQARTVRPEDEPLVQWLGEASARGLSVKALVQAVVTNDSFATRLP